MFKTIRQQIFFSLLIIFFVQCKETNRMKTEKLPEEVATLNRPAKSPSGIYYLHVVIPDKDNPEELGFEIKDIDNNIVVYRSDKTFNDRHTTFFLWDDKDRIWVYSGDTGTFFWEERNTKGRWTQFTYVKENVPAPQFLKEIRPDRYKF